MYSKGLWIGWREEGRRGRPKQPNKINIDRSASAEQLQQERRYDGTVA
jgi:hypothetical protein